MANPRGRPKGSKDRPRETMSPEEVRAWRERHNLTQGAMGKLIGVSRIAVGHWETGISRCGGPARNYMAVLDAMRVLTARNHADRVLSDALEPVLAYLDGVTADLPKAHPLYTMARTLERANDAWVDLDREGI